MGTEREGESNSLELQQLSMQGMFNAMLEGKSLELFFSTQEEGDRFVRNLRVFVSRQRQLIQELDAGMEVGILSAQFVDVPDSQEVKVVLKLVEKAARLFSVRVLESSEPEKGESGEKKENG